MDNKEIFVIEFCVFTAHQRVFIMTIQLVKRVLCLVVGYIFFLFTFYSAELKFVGL